jgi:hypothetical protein
LRVGEKHSKYVALASGVEGKGLCAVMTKRLAGASWLLVAFVVLDLIYSYWQYYQIPVDGDMAAIILPTASCAIVLEHPFGLHALLTQEYYLGPNRFFAHAGMLVFFRYVPLALQLFLSPIDSIYAACALLKVLTQASLVYLLAVFATGTGRLTDRRLWLAMALITPVFQAKGYHDEMGIIDRSITYATFYAVPMVGILLYLLPFHRAAWWGKPLAMRRWQLVVWPLLAVVLALSGPLVAPVGLLLVPVLLLRQIWLLWPRGVTELSWGQQMMYALRAVPRTAWILLGWLGVLCLYSLWVGQYNLEGQIVEVSIKDRYEKMWIGLYSIIAGSLGVPALFLGAVLNHYLLRALPLTPERRRLVILSNWVFVLALVYLVLLPFGGYRTYRPTIIRRDTLIPITLGLTLFFTMSALYLVRELPARFRAVYAGVLLLFVFIYTNSDRPIKDTNECERSTLAYVQQATTNPVKLPPGCNLLTWYPIPDPNSSETQVRVLAHWNILSDSTRYYQDAPQ